MKLITLNNGIKQNNIQTLNPLSISLKQPKLWISILHCRFKKLPLDEYFHIYHHSSKGSGGYQQAFPIPSTLYHSLKIDHYSLKWLNIFYQLYYQDAPPPPWKWKHWDTYIGEKYVWIYKTE